MNKTTNLKITNSYAYLLAFLISPDTLALEMEFYTYGGFQEIVDTFRRLALIYSDNRLAAMFTVAAGLGAIIIATNNSIMAPIMGGRVDPFAWLKTVVLGTTIFTATIIPTGTLHIYDPIANSHESVVGVPDGIILIAGLFNKLERGMVDITTTASAHPYDKTAGGINFKLLMDTIYKTKHSSLYYLSADVKEYYAVCGTLAEGIAGTNTSVKILKSQTTSLFGELPKYRNPAVWVNLYNGNKTKTNMSCSDAWDNVLSPTLTTGAMEDITQSICKSNNFDVNDNSQLQACKSLIEQFYTLHGTSVVDANSYVREAFIYKSILNALTSDPQEAQLMLTRRALVLQGIGAFNAANDLLPHLKAVMSAIILGLFPLLSVFLVTPVFREAAKFMFGSILWLTTWGVAIAITHSAAVDGALSAFTDIENNNMGLASFMLAEEAAIKALSFFGRMQAMSLLIASSLAMALYKFGGYALTQMAHSQAQNIQNLGEVSANSALTPEGRAGLRDNYAQGLASEGAHPPTHAMTNQGSQWGPSPEEAAAAARLGQGFGGGQAAMEAGSISGNGAMDSAQDSSYVSQTQQLADNRLLGQMQSLYGDGNQHDGANLFSGSASEQYAKLDNLQNLAGLQGYDPNSPQALMSVNKDLADDGALDMSGRDVLSNDMLKDQLNSSDRQLLEDNPNQRFAVKPSFNQDSGFAEVSNVGISSYSDTSVSDNTTSSQVNTTTAGTSMTAATIGTAIQDINQGNNNTIAAKGFDSLVDHSNRDEADFKEQDRRTLESQMVGWWKSNGFDASENIQDSSSKATTEVIGIDSEKAMLGKIASKVIGTSARFEGSARQETSSEETMQFNSLNEVASKFIDEANGDSQRLAQLTNDFDQHSRELRAENTSSNTGVTSNINNDADGIVNKQG